MRGITGRGWFAAFVVAVAALVMFDAPRAAAGGDADDVQPQVDRLIGADAGAVVPASDALVKMGTKSVPALVAALASSPVAARVAVLETLGRIAADHDESGSWDPIDPWSVEGGRVYSTAMCCLCLESYYPTEPPAEAK